jgi:hypothetical protein
MHYNLKRGQSLVNTKSNGKLIFHIFFNEIITLDNLLKSIDECYKATPWKRSSQFGYCNRILIASKLLESLNNETYIPKNPRKFTINERGKTRNIDSYTFVDKVVQKLLAQNILLKIINKSCIYDTYACLKGKGTEKARDRLADFLVSDKNKYNEFYIAKLDISKYFESIKINKMLELIKDLVDDKLFRLFQRMYREDYLSLGSELNQLFATLYLNRLDHKIKEYYQIKHYVRYQDDFILISNNFEYLKFVIANIEIDLRDIGLKLNTKKTKIEKFKKIEFLKVQFKFNKDGNLCKRKINKSIRFLFKKIRKIKKLNLEKEYLINYRKSILGQFKKLNNFRQVSLELNKLF